MDFDDETAVRDAIQTQVADFLEGKEGDPEEDAQDTLQSLKQQRPRMKHTATCCHTETVSGEFGAEEVERVSHRGTQNVIIRSWHMSGDSQLLDQAVARAGLRS